MVQIFNSCFFYLSCRVSSYEIEVNLNNTSVNSSSYVSIATQTYLSLPSAYDARLSNNLIIAKGENVLLYLEYSQYTDDSRKSAILLSAKVLLTSKASNKESLITKQIQNFKIFLKKTNKKESLSKQRLFTFEGLSFGFGIFLQVETQLSNPYCEQLH